MNLYKNVLLVLTILLLLILPGCSNAYEIAQYADSITENVLLAINEDDYDHFLQDFDERMKDGWSEIRYYHRIPAIKSKIGQYISKELVSVENKEKFTVVTYRAKFSKESNDVTIRSTFTEENGKRCLDGFWMDSPKLRGR